MVVIQVMGLPMPIVFCVWNFFLFLFVVTVLFVFAPFAIRDA